MTIFEERFSMKPFLTLLILVCLFSCKKDIDLVQYREGQQLLTVNNLKKNGENLKSPDIEKVSRDSVNSGEELVVKIFLKDSYLKIVDAFVDCESVENAMVDTATYKVSGCSKGLVVQNDTIFIGFRPTEPGSQEFPEITILTKDSDKIFRTLKYSFLYKVTASKEMRQHNSEMSSLRD
jgi:hypothetical protein